MLSLKDEATVTQFRGMRGTEDAQNRPYVVKRYNLPDLYLTKAERGILLEAMATNLKIVTIGFFTLVLSSISAIEPREEII